MKLLDMQTKQLFRGTLLETDGNVIKLYSIENDLLAKVPISQAKLIFNEKEIPSIEELK